MAHQDELFANQLGAFFGVKEAVASLAIDAVRSDLKYLQIFVEPASTKNEKLAKAFLLNSSKILMIERLLGLTTAQFTSICNTPKGYKLKGDNTYTLSALLSISALKTLINNSGDTDNELTGYLDLVWSTPSPSAATLIAKLCGLTNWNEQQYSYVINLLGLNAKGCQNLEEIATVKLIFDLALKLKTDVYFLDALSNTTNLAASSANWPTYQSTASKMLLTLQSSSNPNDQTTLKQVNSTIEDKKRDALLWISISVLSNTWSVITTPDNLYEFLMIDPENSG